MKNTVDSNCVGEVVVSKLKNSLIRVVVFVSFVGLLVIVNDQVTIVPSTTSEESMPPSSSTTETARTSASVSSSTPGNAEISYMASERRVPNGPDPIHNRRARKSKEPPGRV